MWTTPPPLFFKEKERGLKRERDFFKLPSHWLTELGPEPRSADPCSDPLPPHHSVSLLCGQTWSSMKMLERKPTSIRTLFPRNCLRCLVYLGSFYSHSASAREPSPWSHWYRNERLTDWSVRPQSPGPFSQALAKGLSYLSLLPPSASHTLWNRL